MTEAKLTIGQFAQAAGVNVETVRYYQRRGLVSLPPKRERGFSVPPIRDRKSGAFHQAMAAGQKVFVRRGGG